MQERMLGESALAEAVGPLKDLMEKLGGREGDQWFWALKRFLRKENPWEGVLGFLGTVVVPTMSESFVVKEDFGGVFWMGDNFRQWFLEKTEEPQPQTQLRYAQLIKRSVDESIIAELGGESAAATLLVHVDWLMRQQANGEEGVLLTNGWANIFYLRDANGTLRAVGVGRNVYGWSVDAYSVELPDAWDDGFRVFSRNSSDLET